MTTGRAMARVFTFVVVGWPLTAAAAPRRVEKGTLVAGDAREAEIPSGTRHLWRMPVARDGVYEVRVEQLGQNLTLILDPGNGKTRQADDRRGWSGAESMRWIAPKTGRATLGLATATDRAGRYRLELRSFGRASEADRRRDDAERLMARGTAGGGVPSWRAAARAFAALGLPEREAVALFKLADDAAIGMDESLYPEALESALRGLELADRLGDDDARAESLYARAGALWVLGRLDEAAVAYLESAAIYERRGEGGPLALVFDALAQLHFGRGEMGRAQELTERAVSLLEEDGNHRGLVGSENRLASIHGLRGRYAESLAAFEAARDRALRVGDPRRVLQPLVNIGIVYGQLGDAERSLAHLREALRRAEHLKPDGQLRALRAFVHTAIAATHVDLGADDAAATQLRRALALARGSAAWAGVAAEVSSELATLEARRGRFAAAERLFATSLKEAGAFGSEPRIAQTRLAQARARLKAGRLDAAEAALAPAMESFGRLGLVEDEAAGWVVRAGLARARSDLAGAEEAVSRALERIESVRAGVALLDQRARYLGARRSAYDLAVSVLVERDRREPGAGHLARAFETSERARARSLLDEHGRGGAGSGPGLDLAARRRAAFERIARVQRDLLERRTSGKPEDESIRRLERELGEAVEEEESARRASKAIDPEATAALEPAIVSSATAAASLAPDEALLEYHVGREESWAFVVDRAGLRVFPLGSEKTLRDLVRRIRAPLVKPSLFGAHGYAATATAAFEKLVVPVGARLDEYRRLRIVPDGPLWELPFEALVRNGSGGSWRDLDYLVRRWSIGYEPSASVAAFERRVFHASDGPTLVAFANPRAPPAEIRGPVARVVERTVLRAGERWSLPALGCAEVEAREAARVVGTERARVFVGAEARESRAKRDGDVGRARYLLFATHGVVSERMPSQSGLVLSLPGEDGEDGLLQAYEIAGLEIRARLVVLSACESALGPNVRGEGLLGISRAFLQAGAGGVVASLWRVSDCSTAELVPALFRGLESDAEPSDPADALRDAKLELLRRGTFAHPYHWASFVLVTSGVRR